MLHWRLMTSGGAARYQLGAKSEPIDRSLRSCSTWLNAYRDSRPVVIAGDHRLMSLLVYRQFINRDLPRLERGCTSKAMFISRREAVSATRRGHRGDGALHPYHCGNCAGWHLGHPRRAR